MTAFNRLRPARRAARASALCLLALGACLLQSREARAQDSRYEALADVGPPQGQGQWYYQYWNGTSYFDMTWNGSRWVSPDGAIIAEINNIVPGNTNDAVRKWVAPRAGAVRVSGRVRMIHALGGDGINAKIVHNGTVVFNQNVAGTDATGYLPNLTLTVAAGDAVYFRVNKVGTTNGDTTWWASVVEYTDGPGPQWTGSVSELNYGGNVGIGTVAGSESFRVFKPAVNWQNRFSNSSGTGADVYISHGRGYGMHVRGWNADDSVYTLELYNNTARTNAFYNSGRVALGLVGNVGVGTASPTSKLHVAGDITVDGNINAKYQDVAEWVPSTQKLSAGTVVMVDPEGVNGVLASAGAYDTRVAGVISAQPGISLGEKGEGKVLVATTGRVKVRVDATRAPVRAGDLLVSADREGYAMKSQPVKLGKRMIHSPGTIIGKALEPLEKGTGEILVLLSLQ